ncbi:rCG39056 [Rattus norvegicus]|uniref:RCG39056 n=1 Tax=Rattus norvegicus TaxID=10116 RepID=A6JY97_RAT|nr:rCG39056 [Rattus norvegicus]
MTQRKQTSGP